MDIIALIFSLLSIVISLTSVFFSYKMYLIIKKCFGESKMSGDIITKIEEYKTSTYQALKENTEIKNTIHDLFTNDQENISSLIVRKFNPYEDSGGDLSFAVVLLDRKKNGVMLTSLHGRERTRMYTRTISNGIANVELLFDEKEALKEALSKFK